MHAVPTWFLVVALLAMLAPFWWPLLAGGLVIYLWRSQRRVSSLLAAVIGLMVEFALLVWLGY